MSIQTTEHYLGCKQKLRVTVNDKIGIEATTADLDLLSNWADDAGSEPDVVSDTITKAFHLKSLQLTSVTVLQPHDSERKPNQEFDLIAKRGNTIAHFLIATPMGIAEFGTKVEVTYFH